MTETQTTEVKAASSEPVKNGLPVVLTKEAAHALLENVNEKEPKRWMAAMRTTILSAFVLAERAAKAVSNVLEAVQSIGTDVEQLKVDHKKLLDSHVKLVKTIFPQAGAPQAASTEAAQEAAPQAEAAAPAADVAGAAPPPADDSEAQARAEADMDAAIAAAEGKPAMASPTHAAAKRRGK